MTGLKDDREGSHRLGSCSRQWDGRNKVSDTGIPKLSAGPHRRLQWHSAEGVNKEIKVVYQKNSCMPALAPDMLGNSLGAWLWSGLHVAQSLQASVAYLGTHLAQSQISPCLQA